MFFRQIMEAFLVRTEPDSSMVNPAHIHMTSAPQTRNAKGVEDELRLLVNPLSLGDVRPRQKEPNRRKRHPHRHRYASAIRKYVHWLLLRSLVRQAARHLLMPLILHPPSGTLLAEVVGPSPANRYNQTEWLGELMPRESSLRLTPEMGRPR